MCLAEEIEPGLTVGEFAVRLLLAQRSRRINCERKSHDDEGKADGVEMDNGEGVCSGICKEFTDDGDASTEDPVAEPDAFVRITRRKSSISRCMSTIRDESAASSR